MLRYATVRNRGSHSVFYIDKAVIRRREVLFLQIIPTLVVLFAFLLATIFSWSSTVSALRLTQKQELTQKNQEIAVAIRQKMDIYENILRSSTSLFNFSETITRAEWKQYVSTLQITTRYPGLQGIGYLQVIRPQDYDSHIQMMRSQNMPNYTIRPEGVRDLYTSVLYIEPSDDVVQPIVGFDMYSETKRREAIDESSRSGGVVLTDIVDLTESKEPGFLMYMPLFKNVLDFSIPTPNGQTRGFIYAPFRINNFMENTIPATGDNYSFKLYTLQDQGPKLLYETPNFSTVASIDDNQHMTTEISMSGALWRLEGVATPAIVNQDARSQPYITLIGGTIFSVVIASFVYILLSNRTKALAEKERTGIQEAKDELLALASHQLRTPATGVKQYVGMLREGFAGKLDDTQTMLLNKAYESNERQLNTINEMLFVARADAGQLKMEREPFDLCELLNEIIEEQLPAIRDRKQKMTKHLPNRPIFIPGDRPYLRMAIENLVTNASKYTHENGELVITITPHDDVVALQVADNGVGVSKRDQSLLFKKFSRIPNELTNRVSGSGIGLYLTKKVVDAHNGRILFHSKEKKGTEITILLPTQTTNQLSKHPGKSPHRRAQSASQD